jgi:hypothetical protein
MEQSSFGMMRAAAALGMLKAAAVSAMLPFRKVNEWARRDAALQQNKNLLRGLRSKTGTRQSGVAAAKRAKQKRKNIQLHRGMK